MVKERWFTVYETPIVGPPFRTPDGFMVRYETFEDAAVACDEVHKVGRGNVQEVWTVSPDHLQSMIDSRRNPNPYVSYYVA